MGRGFVIIRIVFIVKFVLSISILSCQTTSILDFTVKDLNGDTFLLKERLDPNSNYIFEAMAFWCTPCIKSIEKFNYHKHYWKDRFNTDIILIEDEHWDDIPYVENEMMEYGWDLDIVVSNDQFSSAGISAIPRYYFKAAASDTVERVVGNIEKFLLERTDSIHFFPILDTDFRQVVVQENCVEATSYVFDEQLDTIINEERYSQAQGLLLREDELNGNILTNRGWWC